MMNYNYVCQYVMVMSHNKCLELLFNTCKKTVYKLDMRHGTIGTMNK